MQLPFATGSIDIVTLSQVLHHFDGADVEQRERRPTGGTCVQHGAQGAQH
ncbi:MAG: methyltransferase domain-containing protein, partial [Gemmatimonas sp.]